MHALVSSILSLPKSNLRRRDPDLRADLNLKLRTRFVQVFGTLSSFHRGLSQYEG
jgi:hypothetical protein